MRRWQVTAVLVVLAGAGVSVAVGLPVGAVAIDHGRSAIHAVWNAVVPTGHDDLRVDPLPIERRPPVAPEVHSLGGVAERPSTTIPELSDPVRPRPVITVLPPDPEPVRYGCGGRAVPLDQPAPACGMG